MGGCSLGLVRGNVEGWVAVGSPLGGPESGLCIDPNELAVPRPVCSNPGLDLLWGNWDSCPPRAPGFCMREPFTGLETIEARRPMSRHGA